MIVRLRQLSELFRSSLFFVPVLCVLAAVALAEGMLVLDGRIAFDPVPSVLRFTVDSAREVLSTIASAILTVAAIVFALTGLSVQLASSQYSPRVVRGFLRDPGGQLTIGITVGTFTYALVVLREVRSVEGAPDVVAALPTALALGLAVASVVTIVGFVSRTAHRLQASELIRSVAEETVETVCKLLPPRGEGHSGEPPSPAVPGGHGRPVRSTSTGWVDQLSTEDLLEALPPGGTARLEVEVGEFVYPGRRLCTVWGDADDVEAEQRKVNRAFAIGATRTMQQDVAFGIRQIADIALRALSPAVNDPTTGNECVVHLGAVLFEVLRRDLPLSQVTGEHGRRVLRLGMPGYADYVSEACDQIRHTAAPLPRFSAALVQTLAQLAQDLVEDGAGDQDRLEPLVRQARLVVTGVEESCRLPEDSAPAREAAHRLFELASSPARPAPRPRTPEQVK